jgi:hypothetical protein
MKLLHSVQGMGDDVIWNAQMLGDVARIVHVVERTAAAGDAAFRSKLRQSPLIPKLHGQADNALALTPQ